MSFSFSAAGSGLGRGVTRHVRAEGAQVAIMEISANKVVDLKAEFGDDILVVRGDVTSADDLEECKGVHQVCDPVRPATYMRIGDNRYRWEFRLRPGESAADFPDLDTLRPLIAPWAGHLSGADLELVRVTDYTFRAQVADRWRDRQVFLLGDAAHLTPPFVGQGMGAGLRDASNLAWKLAGVLDGTLPDTCLDTYDQERKPHAHHMIRLAIAIGWAMTEGGRVGNVVRRRLAPLAARIPGLSAKVTDSATPALYPSAFVHRNPVRRGLVGALCPNPVLDGDGRRLDDTVPARFLFVTAREPSAGQRYEIERRGAVVVPAPPGSHLGRWLAGGHAVAAIVRPDRTVMRTGRSLSALHTAIPTFNPPAQNSILSD